MDSVEYQKKVVAGLGKQIADGIKANYSGGLLFIILGILLLILEFAFIYFGVGIVFGWLASTPSWIRSCLGFAVLGLQTYLHFQNPVLKKDTLEIKLPQATDPIQMEIPHSSWNRQIELLLPYQRRNFQVLVKSVCLFAPQFIAAGKECLNRAVRMREIDLEKSARIVAMLLGKTNKIPLEVIHPAFPEGDLLMVLTQLSDLEGVELLPDEQNTLMLSAQLRQEILAEFYD